MLTNLGEKGEGPSWALYIGPYGIGEQVFILSLPKHTKSNETDTLGLSSSLEVSKAFVSSISTHFYQ